jgi:hypothetical protein
MAMTANSHVTALPVGAVQLDLVLPVQFFEPRRRRAAEHHLMAAVLLDALACVEKYRFATTAHEQRLFREAKQWLLAHDEVTWPYSFESICGALDLDAHAVRERLRIVR